mgnify:CR=1 FL=1
MNSDSIPYAWGRLLGLCALRRAVRSCRARAFRAAVASATDGARSRGRVGPRAATRYRSAPRAGLRALGPRPGPDRDRAGCIFTSRCVGAPSMRSHRRTVGSDVAACAVRADCSPFGRLPSPLVRPGCGGYWGVAVLTPICHGPGLTQGRLCGLPGLRSNSAATSCGSAGIQPAPGCRTRRFRCVCDGRDRLVRVRARCCSSGSSLSAASLWPYATPFTTVYPPAVPPRRRGRFRCVYRRTAVGEAPTRGDRLGIWW